jgi:fructose-1,6-bisphosphatase/inositol monophosphatase family enzyme
MALDLDDVVRLLQDAAEQVIDPRFRSLQAGEVHEKEPGDLVTEADREAEVLITAGLRRLDPEAVVVGEEAVAADPGVLDLLRTAPRVWVVDPVDGTANFVAGSPEHAVMAALVERGRPVAAVIWQPQLRTLFTAERGAGAYVDGRPLGVPPPLPRDPAQLSGAVAATYLDPATRARVDANTARFAAVRPGPRCCGVSYPRMATGEEHFALFWKMAPWDHAPGALLVEECGGAVRRWDGEHYRVDVPGTGLLAVSDAAAWDDVRAALLDP